MDTVTHTSSSAVLRSRIPSSHQTGNSGFLSPLWLVASGLSTQRSWNATLLERNALGMFPCSFFILDYRHDALCDLIGEKEVSGGLQDRQAGR